MKEPGHGFAGFFKNQCRLFSPFMLAGGVGIVHPDRFDHGLSDFRENRIRRYMVQVDDLHIGNLFPDISEFPPINAPFAQSLPAAGKSTSIGGISCTAYTRYASAQSFDFLYLAENCQFLDWKPYMS